VRATDAAGNTDQTPATRTWTVDTVTPDTAIDSGPSGTVNTAAASFAFSASEAGASFECRLDGGAWAGCTSPRAYSGLNDGAHTFEVRARDAAGNTDQTPASRSWTISALFADGFETGSFSSWTEVATGADGTATVQTGLVRAGTYAARLSATGAAGSFAYARRFLGASHTTLRAGGDFTVLAEGPNSKLVPFLRFFSASGARIVGLYRQNLSGSVRVQYGSKWVSTDATLPMNTWARMELYVVVGGNASRIEVRVDGQLIYDTTKASLGTAGVATLQIGDETKREPFTLVADDISASGG
jgi:hypothetical protein